MSFNHKKVLDFLIYINTFLILVIILVKTFTCYLAVTHFKVEFNKYDLMVNYSSDLLLWLVFFMLVQSVIKFKSIHLKKSVCMINICAWFLIIIHLIVITYFLYSAYIFYEWGAFIELHHVKAAMKSAGVGKEVKYFITKLPFIIFLSLCFSGIVLSYYYRNFLISVTRNYKFYLVVVVLSLLAYYPLTNDTFAPFVSSPIFLLSRGIMSNTDGVDEKLLDHIDFENFQPYQKRDISPNFKYLKGIAKNKNIIFVVMESVRKKNLNLYGYDLPTMPNLNSLATHSIVFQNATVNQPRSCKTMESMILGIYPDPRLRAITWRSNNIFAQQNLIKKFTEAGYKFYFASSYDQDGDGFKDFLLKMSGGSVDMSTQEIILKKRHIPAGKTFDEKLLADEFLSWSSKQDKPFFSILWTKSAHVPYQSSTNRFDNESLTGRYNNCLFNIDEMIGKLVKGLKVQNKLSNTLIVIFGDHGEAIDDKFDWGHGNFLYEHSIKIPFIIYNAELFSKRMDVLSRFQPKDIAATLLYLCGINSKLNQSQNIFSLTPQNKIYLTNVYQDYKLGMLFGKYKFVYRPRLGLSYIFDLSLDPQETQNIISKYSTIQIQKMKKEVLSWYKYQLSYLENNIRVS